MIGFYVLVLLVLALLLAGPWWPYSRRWGFTPAGVILAGLLLWALIAWLAFIPFAWPWAVAARGPDLP
ncbi:MAG TPA: DUF3309 family protein [Falsiroseomonas sp.]|nr:DUF3309 family protein [Falsiroseomonas sp.]